MNRTLWKIVLAQGLTVFCFILGAYRYFLSALNVRDIGGVPVDGIKVVVLLGIIIVPLVLYVRWSETVIQHARILVPKRPELLHPASEAYLDTQHVHLEWSGVKNASSYELEVREEHFFGKLIISHTVKETRHVTPRLEKHINYYWRVRACRVFTGIELHSKWTEWRRFNLA